MHITFDLGRHIYQLEYYNLCLIIALPSKFLSQDSLLKLGLIKVNVN